jgi:large subunit ribosomal protein L24
MTIRKGDTVQVIAGKEKGKKGPILTLDRAKNRVVVDGVNLRTRHLKPTQSRPKGGIVQLPGSMARANVILLCGHCGKLTRGRMLTENDHTYRACSFCTGAFDQQ